MSSRTIHVAAVVILDPAHRVLTVRKHGTTRFMQPGGKPEPGEDGRQTAVREVAEEVGMHLRAEDLTAMGSFSAPAANEADSAVVCENFLVAIDDDGAAVLDHVQPAAEIAELRWIPLDAIQPAEHLAPLLTHAVGPAVRELIALRPTGP